MPTKKLSPSVSVADQHPGVFKFLAKLLWKWPVVLAVCLSILLTVWSTLIGRNDYWAACLVSLLALIYLGAKCLHSVRGEAPHNVGDKPQYIVAVVFLVVAVLDVWWTTYNLSSPEGLRVSTGVFITSPTGGEPFLMMETGANGLFLAPVNVLVSFTISNDASTPRWVGIVELQYKDGVFGWSKLRTLETNGDVFFSPDQSRKHAKQVVFDSPNISLLAKRPIAAKSTASAYGIFTSATKFELKKNREYRLRVCDTDDRCTYAYHGKGGDNSLNGLLMKDGESRDLSDIYVGTWKGPR